MAKLLNGPGEDKSVRFTNTRRENCLYNRTHRLFFLGGYKVSDVFTITRLAVHIVSSIGVSKVVNDIIKNNTNVVTTADAIKVTAGSLVIGSMVAEKASRHVNDRVDSVFAWYQSRKEDDIVAG
jgi:hypothetical protein